MHLVFCAFLSPLSVMSFCPFLDFWKHSSKNTLISLLSFLFFSRSANKCVCLIGEVISSQMAHHGRAKVQSVCAICMSADDGYPCSDFKGCKRAKMVVAAFVDFDSWDITELLTFQFYLMSLYTQVITELISSGTAGRTPGDMTAGGSFMLGRAKSSTSEY